VIVTRDTKTVDLASIRERLTATIEPLFDNVPLPDKLQRLTAAALDSVPGVDGYGVCLFDGDSVAVQASSGDLVDRLHAVQESLEDGPCWETLHGGKPTAVYEDILPAGSDVEVTTYREAAGRAGVRSQLSVRIQPRKRLFGALTVISTTTERAPIQAESLELIGNFVGLAVDQAVLRGGIDEGLRGRTVIGEAIGILMERFELDEDVAFDYLKRQSSTTNRKLRDVAETVVSDRRGS
jgi:hypothetical protein